jgi:predicted tellurium resistance membrane protein TerC
VNATSLGMEISAPGFWLSVLEIVWINILLSGDNAVVIALACRGLPPRERLWGMVIGAGVASVLLIVFTGVVSALLTLPYIKLAGAIALFWIAIKLLEPQGHDKEDTPEAVEDLWRAVRIVVIAGSAVILALLERFPVLVWGGAAILGWVAGDIFASDPIVLGLFSGFSPDHVELAAQIAGAIVVVASGYAWRRWHHVVLEET